MKIVDKYFLDLYRYILRRWVHNNWRLVLVVIIVTFCPFLNTYCFISVSWLRQIGNPPTNLKQKQHVTLISSLHCKTLGFQLITSVTGQLPDHLHETRPANRLPVWVWLAEWCLRREGWVESGKVTLNGSLCSPNFFSAFTGSLFVG